MSKNRGKARKQERREDAARRTAERSARTASQQLDLIIKRPGKSAKECERLYEQVGHELTRKK